MRSHAFFRDVMHFLRANLHLQRLSAMKHGSVQRLIKFGRGIAM